MKTLATRRNAMGLLMVGALAASIGTAGASLALFTDSETVDATFSSGSIILDAGKIDALTFTSGVMMPGDVRTGEVVVENDGSGQLRYALSTSSTDASSDNGDPLYTVLTVAVKGIDVDGVGCGSFDGAVITAAATLGASSNVFGTPAAGGGNGERTLNATSSETLCIQVALPLATGNEFQSASTVTTFTFSAEQTANNA